MPCTRWILNYFFKYFSPMFSSLSHLFWGDNFNMKIQVTLVDHLYDTVIEVVEFEQQYLPEDFNETNSIFIENAEWKIISAYPAHAHQYSKNKKVTLRVKNMALTLGYHNLKPPIEQYTGMKTAQS